MQDFIKHKMFILSHNYFNLEFSFK